MKVRECLRSGLCCRKAPCPYGSVISTINTQCAYLIENSDQTTTCGKYEDIKNQPGATFSPAFGFGCCMPLGNQIRNSIVKQTFNGEEQYIEIDDF